MISTRKIKGREFREDQRSGSFIDRKNLICQYKDKTGIRIYVGESTTVSGNKYVLFQIIFPKKFYNEYVYVYSDIGLKEFYRSYKQMLKYKTARRWFLKKLREFGSNVSLEIDRILSGYYFNEEYRKKTEKDYEEWLSNGGLKKYPEYITRLERKIARGFSEKDIVKGGINALDSRVHILINENASKPKENEKKEVIRLKNGLGWYIIRYE